MEEQIVSLKVAKLLEEHNFCNGSSHYYDKHGFFVLIELNSIGLYPHIVGGELDYKGDYYLSYESALEEGLLMALRYL